MAPVKDYPIIQDQSSDWSVSIYCNIQGRIDLHVAKFHL